MRTRIRFIGGATMSMLLLLAARPANAQQPGQGAGAASEIRGSVAGADAQPLGASTVELYSSSDSLLVTGALTDAGGRFRIQGLRPGAYRMRVTFVGYEANTSEVAVPAATTVVDVGVITLAVSAVALDAVEASAERGVVSLQVDRTVYHARQAGSAGGNATDVLRNVPGVEVDAEGRVSLRGSSNVAVQLNGRAAPLRGDALASFLRQLPASTLDRVEVVSNPSARYDPEGMGGIINIVMRQDTELGLSGGVNATAGTGGKYNGSGNLGYQAGRLTLFGTVGLNQDSRDNQTYTFRESAFTGTRTFMEQHARGDIGQTGVMFNGSADLRVGRTGTVSSSLMVNRISAELATGNSYHSFDADRSPTGLLQRSSDLEQRVLMADASVAYRRAVSPTNDLSAEVRYNRNADDLASRFFNGAPEDVARTLYQGREVDGVTDEYTVQADATRRIGSVTVQFGQKATLRTLNNSEAVEHAGSAALANDFTYDETILALYGVLSRDIGRLSLQGGLRAERTATEFAVTGGTSFDNDYVSMFPSASALYAVDQNRRVRLSYARRIQRPQSRFLSPFAMTDDPLNQFVGNPELGPEHTDAIELSLQQSGSRGSLQIQPFLRRTTDAMRVIKSVDADGMATTTFRNLATARSYGTDVTATGRFGSTVQTMVSVSGFRMTTDAGGATDVPTSDALTWNARGSMSWTVTPKTVAQWQLHHRAPVNVEGGRIRAFTVSTFAVQQKVLGDRGTVSLRVMDPLDAMKLRFSTSDAYHAQTSWRKTESRVAQLSFGYAFGQQPRIRQRPAQQQEDPLQIRIQ